MARNETGVMVRVRPDTLARLDAIRKRLTLAAADGLMAPWWADDEPSNNEIVGMLIMQYERKRERSRKARRAARRRKDMEALEDVYGPTMPWWAPGTIYDSLNIASSQSSMEVDNGR